MKKIATLLITSIILTSSLANALELPNQELPGQFSIKIPLELKDGGSLPDGSIIIGDGSGNNGGTNPTNPTDPTNPTNPTEPFDCSYDITNGLTTYVVAEGVDSPFYNNLPISNGHKGKLMYSEGGYDFYEICLNGQAPIYTGTPPDEPPTDPTTPSECLYDIENSLSVYAVEGTEEQKYYQNVPISNGYKGKLMFSQGDVYYYEMCMNGETPIPANQTPPPVEDPVPSEGCGYNKSNLYWREVSTDNDLNYVNAFTNLVFGSSSISYNVTQSRVRYPDGTIDTAYGKILPSDNTLIGLGSIYFYRGELKESLSMGNGQTEYLYENCKGVAN